MRIRAVVCGLWYGLAPWNVHDSSWRAAHDGMTYREHLSLNLSLAWRWMTWRENADDVRFELDNNHRGA